MIVKKSAKSTAWASQFQGTEGVGQAEAQGHLPVHQGRGRIRSHAGDVLGQGTPAEEAEGRGTVMA